VERKPWTWKNEITAHSPPSPSLPFCFYLIFLPGIHTISSGNLNGVTILFNIFNELMVASSSAGNCYRDFVYTCFKSQHQCFVWFIRTPAFLSEQQHFQVALRIRAAIPPTLLSIVQCMYRYLHRYHGLQLTSPIPSCQELFYAGKSYF